MPDRIVHIPDIGSARLVRSKRAKRMNISIKPHKGIRVAVPFGVRFSEAIRFAESRAEWIRRHLPRVQALEQARLVFDADTEFRTWFHELYLRHMPVENLVVRVGHGQIRVDVPEEIPMAAAQVQEAVRQGIVVALRKEAKAYLPERTALLATRHRLAYENVFVKNLKSRWGSCSNRNNINLNIHLMRLPSDLIDYVILHELAHTRIKNHSPAFWSFLNQLTEQKARILDRALKAYRPAI